LEGATAATQTQVGKNNGLQIIKNRTFCPSGFSFFRSLLFAFAGSLFLHTLLNPIPPASFNTIKESQLVNSRLKSNPRII
jgi:hypothetical protein